MRGARRRRPPAASRRSTSSRTGWAREVVAPARRACRERVAVGVTGATDHDLERDPRPARARLPQRGARARSATAVPARAGAGADAPRRVRHPAGLRPLPHPGPVRGLPRTAAAHRAGPAAGVRAGARTAAPGWACPECGGHGLRAPVLGDARTAEELGRAFPGSPVRTSSAGDRVLAEVDAEPAIVVATPGAEPVAEGGYAAVRAARHLAAARPAPTCAPTRRRCAAGPTPPRWCARRPSSAGWSRSATRAHPALQALVRWDPAGFAAPRDRGAALGAPAARLAGWRPITGEPDDLEAALPALHAPRRAPRCSARCPVEARDARDEEQVRYVVRVPRAAGPALSRALGELQAQRSARKLPHVRVQVDPAELG